MVSSPGWASRSLTIKRNDWLSVAGKALVSCSVGTFQSLLIRRTIVFCGKFFNPCSSLLNRKAELFSIYKTLYSCLFPARAIYIFFWSRNYAKCQNCNPFQTASINLIFTGWFFGSLNGHKSHEIRFLQGHLKPPLRVTFHSDLERCISV